ncbi:squalene synthetase-like protein, partial [Cryomyces antarcticus]
FEAEVAQFIALGDAECEADTDEEEEEEEEEEEDSDQADLESSLDGDERERWLDEEDLRQRRKGRMDDETIARLLAKQEELGMGSDELLLYDDDGDEMNLDIGLLPSSSKRTNTILRPSRQHGRGSKRARGEYPAAGLFADVLDQDPYNGFDIMDFDRPSLKKKPKARRETLPFELSDEELAGNLQTAWLADRDKKKLKKAERQELRAQGLLGKKNQHKTDLSMKYVEGMSIVQIKAEFKAFLDSPHQSRPFPPMDKRDRKTIHEIASVFKLKSKSAGAGKNRFPVVIKTRLTQEYQEDTFDALYAKLSRRFFPRMDKKGGLNRDGARGKGKAAIPRRGFGAAQAGYRDGEIVGATAPEIGIDNRGRAMLEKMGWNTGMALGALGNDRGILQPIAHVVKTSKAGLG